MDNIKFLSLVKTVQQLSFEGRPVRTDVPVGECHIMYMDTCICGTNKEKLKAEHDTKQVKTTKLRPEGVKMCVKCEQGYKTRKDLAWKKWVKNTV